MKRIIIYILVTVLALLVPENGTDVGKLQPVELVFLSIEDGQIVLETDTGGWGQSETLNGALENLKETTAGVIFLDTADYLLVTQNAEYLLGEMEGYVKPRIRVCRAEQGIDLVEAARYLGVHPPRMTLNTREVGEKLPELEQITVNQKIFQKISN